MTETGAILTLWPLNYVDSLYKYVLASKSSPFCSIILMVGLSFLQSKRWPLLSLLLHILLSCSYTGLTEFRTAKTSNSAFWGIAWEGAGFDQCQQKTGCETSNSVCFGFVCEGVGFDQCQQKLVTAVSDCAFLVLCVKVLDLTSITKNWLHLHCYRNKWLCLSGIVCESAGPDQHH